MPLDGVDRFRAASSLVGPSQTSHSRPLRLEDAEGLGYSARTVMHAIHCGGASSGFGLLCEYFAVPLGGTGAARGEPFRPCQR